MSLSAVQGILNRVDSLSESDRELLEKRLAERVDAQWRRESEAACKQARERNIDPAAIDEAVRRHRYGS